MKRFTKEEALAQIDQALTATYTSPFNKTSLAPSEFATTLLGDTIRRLAPKDSLFAAKSRDPNVGSQRMHAVLAALKHAIENDLLHEMTELAHASLSADILDQAHTLLSKGYKDAAAVLVGSTLEAHLRNLCDKFGVDTMKPDGRAEPASKLNADLKKAEAYDKQDEKMVTAWLDLRNEAAHGHYDKYQQEQVGVMLSGVRDFVFRHPA